MQALIFLFAQLLVVYCSEEIWKHHGHHHRHRHHHHSSSSSSDDCKPPCRGFKRDFKWALNSPVTGTLVRMVSDITPLPCDIEFILYANSTRVYSSDCPTVGDSVLLGEGQQFLTMRMVTRDNPANITVTEIESKCLPGSQGPCVVFNSVYWVCLCQAFFFNP